ncbi:MAG: shikimate dehydrogenase family protein [Gemmatimonadaceae bacterium]
MSDLPGRLVLLGHPVAHSLSPAFQNAALRGAGSPLRYEALDVPPEALAATWALLRGERAAGNVTIPHKEAVARLCDRLTPLALRVGAVNTFWCEGEIAVGDNTDVGGFDAAVRELLGDALAGRRVAVIGAGGSAAAVLAALERWPGSAAAVWSRTAERAAALAARFAAVASAVERLADALRDADLVVNATPVGLRTDDVPVPLALLRRSAAVVDLVYRRDGPTPWVRQARARGLRATDGLPMLVEQGALAFERWLGRAPDRAAMWAAVREAGAVPERAGS